MKQKTDHPIVGEMYLVQCPNFADDHCYSHYYYGEGYQIAECVDLGKGRIGFDYEEHEHDAEEFNRSVTSFIHLSSIPPEMWGKYKSK